MPPQGAVPGAQTAVHRGTPVGAGVPAGAGSQQGGGYGQQYAGVPLQGNPVGAAPMNPAVSSSSSASGVAEV